MIIGKAVNIALLKKVSFPLMEFPFFLFFTRLPFTARWTVIAVSPVPVLSAICTHRIATFNTRRVMFAN